MRYFIELSYKGTAYHGWQIQANALSVQEEVNRALSTYLRVDIMCVGSGRTDTGVHATQQWAHFDHTQKIAPEDFIYKINKLLPGDIAVHRINETAENAHARFDATQRSYVYKIHQKKSPFLSESSYYYPFPLDLETMNEAARLLLGAQNFQTFSKVKTDVSTFNCNITAARWNVENDKLMFHVSADRFLRGMVRTLVGTLLEVGQGKLTSDQFSAIIQSKDRKKAGRSVPAHGLYLCEVVYPENTFLKC